MENSTVVSKLRISPNSAPYFCEYVRDNFTGIDFVNVLSTSTVRDPDFMSTAIERVDNVQWVTILMKNPDVIRFCGDHMVDMLTDADKQMLIRQHPILIGFVYPGEGRYTA